MALPPVLSTKPLTALRPESCEGCHLVKDDTFIFEGRQASVFGVYQSYDATKDQALIKSPVSVARPNVVRGWSAAAPPEHDFQQHRSRVLLTRPNWATPSDAWRLDASRGLPPNHARDTSHPSRNKT